MGYGAGQIIMKRNAEGGKTWSNRLEVPENWSASREVPTIFRTADNGGVKRLILFSGLYPAKLSFSEDDGITWTPLEPVGDWVAWVGTYYELVNGVEGQYRVRLKDNKVSTNCAYCGVEILKDRTFVLTTHGHWEIDEGPYIVSIRLKLEELDEIAGLKKK